ncbi:MAG: ribose-phosphate pyrophosphokinase [Vampirovibrionales bacterium]|nr:ribose-phosphate pyrophosphokinase [Vampirovibrionales bacterium]
MSATPLTLPTLETLMCEHDTSNILIFSGRSNPALAQEMAQCLGTELGNVLIKTFSDGETYVQVQENVRGRDVFVIQSTCHPVNQNLMELLLMIDALKRASAKSITAVMPYFGYARQDRKTQGREAISAKLVADMIATAGATRVVAMDLHTGQLQGFFNILTDHLYATPLLTDYASRRLAKGDLVEPVVVSPDAGGVERARVFAKKLNAPIAIIDKRRSAHNVSEVYHIIGDVAGKTAVIVDDMIDTAGTVCAGAKLLKDHGAKYIMVMAAHPVLSGPAAERIANSTIDELIVTNSIPLTEASQNLKSLIQLSAAPLLAEAIGRIHDHQSVSEMFE